MKKVIVVGEVYSPNLGDGVIYACLEKLLGEHSITGIPLDLSGLDTWVEVNEPEQQKKRSVSRTLLREVYIRVRFIRRMHSLYAWYCVNRTKYIHGWDKKIAASDAMIVGGGQLLTDINLGFTPKIHDAVMLAKRHNIPVAFYGCGAGSQWGLISRILYGRCLNYAKYISVRDASSMVQPQKSLGGSLQVNVHSDIVFSLSESFDVSSGAAAPGSLGICFQPVSHMRNFISEVSKISDDDYLEFWSKTIGTLVKLEHNVVIFTNGDPADYAQAQLVIARMAREGRNVELLSRPTCPAELVEAVATMDAVIVTRMHAGIIAFALGKKVVPIVWDQKVANVWSQLGLEGILVPGSVFLRKDAGIEFDQKVSEQNSPSEATLEDARAGIRSSLKECLCSLSVL